MLIWFGPEPIIERFKALHNVIRGFIREPAVLSELRPYIWKDTLTLIKDFPVSGTGLGTYSYIFPKYRTFADTYRFLRYAHNDYLQFVSEMGVVAIVFIAGFFVWYVRKVRKCLERFRGC